ncbi:MAG: DNA translocase FtsK [Pirellulaceae bacterium]
MDDDTLEDETDAEAEDDEEVVAIRISGRTRNSSPESVEEDLAESIEAWENGELDEEEAEYEEDGVDELDEDEVAAEAEADEEAPVEVMRIVDKRKVPKPKKPHTDPHFKVGGKKAASSAGSEERDQVIAQLDEAANVDELDDYQLPDIELLLPSDDVPYEAQEKEVRRKAKMIEKTFLEFGFKVKVVEIETGPVIAQYEIQLEAGLRLSKITGLADDLAIALRVPSVRIVAPIPGKNTVGIEVPNEARQVVRLREVMEEAAAKEQKMKIPLYLGKDVSGNSLIVDLASLPHLLIAGRTGTGKSVCLNAIISSILMTRRPDEVRMLMIDPKMVELSGYGRLPHLMHPVVTDMKKAEAILAWAVEKMEERYSLLARAGVRHIVSYNQLGEAELMDRLDPDSDEERAAIPLHLPFIVIVADEMADLMMTAGKEVEQHIIRLAQKSRAVGIHLILATQKPTVDVITGLIKSNLPARLCFQVASRTDSRVVLDEMGADKLLGNGDMLFLWPGTSTLLRGQGTYLSDEEIESITESVSKHGQNFVNELVNLKVEQTGDEDKMGAIRKRDELYESAIDCVVREQRGSVSLLQRTLGIGYGRAARLIDYMAEDGIVGPYNGSQAREILVSLEQWEAMQGNAAPEQAEPKAAAPKTKRNRIRMEEDDEESLAASMPEDSEAEWDEVDEAIASYDDEEEEVEEEEDDSEYDEDEEYDEEEPEEDEDEEEEESEEDEEFEDDVESVDEVRKTRPTRKSRRSNLARAVAARRARTPSLAPDFPRKGFARVAIERGKDNARESTPGGRGPASSPARSALATP